jgi:hypothetical protein
MSVIELLAWALIQPVFAAFSAFQTVSATMIAARLDKPQRPGG